MPIKETVLTTGKIDYGSPFRGDVNYTSQIRINLANLTNKEIDADGFLKPGIPLTRAGALVGVGPAFVYGVTVAPIKVANDNAAGTISALGLIFAAVATICQVNQDIMEDILDRVLTADEIAGFDRAGSKVVLNT